MVPDEKSGPAPLGPRETATASPRRGRGWFELVVLCAVYITASIAAQLLLAAYYSFLDKDDE
jgi:hypothetical protein